MCKKHRTIRRFFSEWNIRFLAFGALCLLGSFVLGIKTAGNVHPVDRSEAVSIEDTLPKNGVTKAGDMNGNGVLDIGDIIAIQIGRAHV